MSNDDKTIDCDQHGKAPMAYVCGHLVAAKANEAIGFYQSHIDLSEPNRSYDAWCRACEDKLVQAGYEWNDLLEQQANIKTVCLRCFEDLKDKQMAMNPADMDLTYVPEHQDIEAFFDVADAHIALANQHVKNNLEMASEAFSYAAARFASFEATLLAKDVNDSKQEIIEYFTLRFKEMFIDNLNDYIENQDDYLKK